MDLDGFAQFDEDDSHFSLHLSHAVDYWPNAWSAELVADTNTRKSRDRTLKDADWAAHRDTITKLYLEQGMKLKDVMREMRERHDFRAERHMYLRRINKWGLNKNYKYNEKQAIAEDLALRSNDEAVAQKTYMIRNRPAQMHRVKRHIKAHKNPDTEASRCIQANSVDTNRPSTTSGAPVVGHQSPHFQPSPIQRDAIARKVNQLYARKSVMNDFFVFDPSCLTTESFLIRIQEYTQVRLGAQLQTRSIDHTEDFDTNGEPDEQRQFFDRLVSAANVYRANSPASFRHELEEACALVKAVLRTAHWRLIIGLLSGLAQLWETNIEVAKQILRFMYDMAKILYGTGGGGKRQHCLVHLLELWLTIEDFHSVMGLVGQVILDATASASSEDSKFSALVRSYLSAVYESWNLKAAADHMAKENYESCLARYGQQSWHTRRAASHLAYGYHKSQRFHHAREILEQSVNGFYQSDMKPDLVSADASALLADTCLALGLFEKSLHYYTLSNLWYEMMEGIRVTRFWYYYNCRMMQLLWERQGVIFKAHPLDPLEAVAAKDAEAHYQYYCSLQYSAYKDKDRLQYLYT